ncbi:MAG: DNA cytosine methyltransferase [Gemmataceae bacterium]|nr:DNA cytosine methyltransferase [Gemmataceae bacterium]
MPRFVEALLDGERVMYAPLGGSALPAPKGCGITAPPIGEEDAAVASVELFAGAGGLALGTAAAGLGRKTVIEWDANACATLRRNRPGWETIEGDVRGYSFNRHRGAALVSGGPPCQPFSIGGKHRGRDDRRNLFPEAVRAVREIGPEAFLFENVRGLLREGFSTFFSYIVLQLRYPSVVAVGDEEWQDHLARLERLHTSGEAPAYNVVWQCVDAVDHGVPQHRWRVFLAGVRSDLGVEYAFPHATHGQDALLHDQWVSGDYWERHEVPMRRRPAIPASWAKRVEGLRSEMRAMMGEPWRTVRDAISDLPPIAAPGEAPAMPNHYLNLGARSYAGHTGSPLDEPAKALKAGDHGVPGGENMLRRETGEVRYFSVRECARLQCFPDDWVFEGSWTESMRQLGNAVPVRLAEAVARPLVRLMRGGARPTRGRRPSTISGDPAGAA